MGRINNVQVDEASDINALMPMYNLVGCSHIQSKASAILWQFHEDVPVANNDNEIVDLNPGNANARSFILKLKLTYQTGNNVKKNVKLMVSLKDLSKFWSTLEMLFINCLISLDLNGSENCIILLTMQMATHHFQ